MIAQSMLDLVGHTPLVRVRAPWWDARRASPGPHARRAAVWAKMEHSNPGGSVKDRICAAMIEDAEARDGLLVGISSGAAMHVALEVARELGDPSRNVVTVLCDTGERYFSLEEHFEGEEAAEATAAGPDPQQEAV